MALQHPSLLYLWNNRYSQKEGSGKTAGHVPTIKLSGNIFEIVIGDLATHFNMVTGQYL